MFLLRISLKRLNRVTLKIEIVLARFRRSIYNTNMADFRDQATACGYPKKLLLSVRCACGRCV